VNQKTSINIGYHNYQLRKYLEKRLTWGIWTWSPTAELLGKIFFSSIIVSFQQKDTLQ
jgi:hypothetical protein